MGDRTAHTEPFQSGQNTNARDKGEKVPVKTNVSKVRNIGQPDMLTQALRGKEPPLLPSDNHKFSHSGTSASGGAHYTPSGEFGRPSGKLGSKATGINSHTSGPGKNPLGNPLNRTGGNPLGGRGGQGTFRGKP